jgi:hypothetical protein
MLRSVSRASVVLSFIGQGRQAAVHELVCVKGPIGPNHERRVAMIGAIA